MANCDMFCTMKNGQKWLHTESGEEIRIEGFGPSEETDFLEEDVKKIEFRRSAKAEETGLASVIVDKSLCEDFENVEEIKFTDVQYAHIHTKFPKLKKLTLCDGLRSFNLEPLAKSANLEKIVFPKSYWETDIFFGGSKYRHFPSEWSKELKIDIVSHFPALVTCLDFEPKTKEESEEIYHKICEETIARAKERTKLEKKEKVIREETNNLLEVQDWLSYFNAKILSVEENLSSVANTNNFTYQPKSK